MKFIKELLAVEAANDIRDEQFHVYQKHLVYNLWCQFSTAMTQS